MYPLQEKIPPLKPVTASEVRLVPKTVTEPQAANEAIPRLASEPVVLDDKTITQLAEALDAAFVDYLRPDSEYVAAEATVDEIENEDALEIHDVLVENTIAATELLVDSNPVLDAFINHLEELEDASLQELSVEILKKVELLDFETARKVEVTLLSIVAIEEITTQNEGEEVQIDPEIKVKLEALYIELAEYLGIEIDKDEPKFEQFRELIQQIIPDLIPAEYKITQTDRGTHEIVSEGTNTSQFFQQVLRKKSSSFHNWLGRYTLQLVGNT